MKILGIIVEYNPFHNGHLYHIKKAKALTKSDYVIALMSGNYVQRGEPSCIDKFTKTKMALLNEVDLVIELPTIFSTSSAEYFAKSSINIFNELNCIDYLCFGSESNNIDILTNIANILLNEPKSFKDELKLNLSKGLSFPKARDISLKKYLNLSNKENFLSSNDILAVEYLKALLQSNSTIKPYSILRNSVNYNEDKISKNISSATYIRKLLYNKDYKIINNLIPNNTINLVKETTTPKIPTLDDFYNLLIYKVLLLDRNSLLNIQEIDNNLLNRILESTKSSNNMQDLIEKIKCKNITRTKIQRCILNICLNITKKEFNNHFKDNSLLYARVIGFNNSSSNLIKYILEKTNIPLLININKDINKLNKKQLTSFHNNIMYTNLYNYIKYKSNENINKDYKQKMIVI